MSYLYFLSNYKLYYPVYIYIQSYYYNIFSALINYDIRYKNFFKEKDEMNQILTEEKNRIKNDLITLKSNFEILYVNCEVPGILNIYFLENNINGMPINGQRIF